MVLSLRPIRRQGTIISIHLKVKIMTNKQRIEMLSRWVKDLNPKAFLHHADVRCGGLYAIATRNDDGSVKIWSQFMKPTELEKALVMYFDNSFNDIKNA